MLNTIWDNFDRKMEQTFCKIIYVVVWLISFGTNLIGKWKKHFAKLSHNICLISFGTNLIEGGFSLDLRSADKELKAVTPEK